jgi:hypothetical protein
VVAAERRAAGVYKQSLEAALADGTAAEPEEAGLGRAPGALGA